MAVKYLYGVTPDDGCETFFYDGKMDIFFFSFSPQIICLLFDIYRAIYFLCVSSGFFKAAIDGVWEEEAYKLTAWAARWLMPLADCASRETTCVHQLGLAYSSPILEPPFLHRF